MGIALMIVVFGYIIVASIIFFIAKKTIKTRWIVIVIALVLILFPFRRVIFYQPILLFYRCFPLQEIHQVVDSPISVYWEDTVWPGFDKYGRHWMVKDYLDGIHLKTLALNGDDGKIYLYRATAEDFPTAPVLQKQLAQLKGEKEKKDKQFKKIYEKEFLSIYRTLELSERMKKKERYLNNHPQYQKIVVLRQQIEDVEQQLQEIKKQGVERIMGRIEIYTDKKELPPLRYRVEFHPLPRSLVVNNGFKMIHADRITIIDTQTEKEIAFSQRYLVYAGIISQFSGEQPKFDMELGDIQPYEFDDKVLFGYAGVLSSYESKRSRLDK